LAAVRGLQETNLHQINEKVKTKHIFVFALKEDPFEVWYDIFFATFTSNIVFKKIEYLFIYQQNLFVT
jgi:hypothetical protein